MAQKKVFVANATGNTGTAVIDCLANEFAGHAAIVAGVRDKQRAGRVARYNVRYDEFDADRSDTLGALEGSDVVVAIPSHHQQNQETQIRAIVDAAKRGNVKHIVMLSAANAEDAAPFARQWQPAEACVRESTLPFTILRFPMVFDNQFMNAGAIRTEDAFYGPVDADTRFGSISLRDAGTAAAHAAMKSEQSRNETLLVTGPEPFSMRDLASAYSELLGRPVHYSRISDELALQALNRVALPQWQAAQVLDLWRDAERGGTQARVTDAFAKLVGRPPQRVQDWLREHRDAFTDPDGMPYAL